MRQPSRAERRTNHNNEDVLVDGQVDGGPLINVTMIRRQSSHDKDNEDVLAMERKGE